MTIPTAAELRALPARPNLQFEEERAKKMVRESAAAASAATGAAVHAEARRDNETRRHADGSNGAMTLSEAQLMIAREYGFSSWKRLSAYYKTWHQHELSGTNGWSLTGKNADNEVTRLLDASRRDHEILQSAVPQTSINPSPPLTPSQLSAIAAFVPRFYGLSDSEIRASELTEAEAQLVVARLRRFPSWQALLDRVEEIARISKDPKYQRAPQGTDEAKEAIRNRDGDALVRLLETHSDCFYRPMLTDSLRGGPVWEIIKQFMHIGDPATRALLDRLAQAGVNIQQHLNSELLAGPFFRIPTEQIRALLELGADPNWIPPTGASVLECAIVRYMNGEAVDLIAARVKPRTAFWIAAGLGDVDTMRTFFNKDGQLTDAARRDRPDALMLGVAREFTRVQRPEALDIEILSEAFFLAGLNGRTAAMQVLLDLGVPIDYAPGNFPLLYLAVAHELVEVVEFLVERSADRDFVPLRGDSARALSLRMIEDTERHPNAARIHALLSR